jgi:hypothetical protein
MCACGGYAGARGGGGNGLKPAPCSVSMWTGIMVLRLTYWLR